MGCTRAGCRAGGPAARERQGEGDQFAQYQVCGSVGAGVG